ncbi:4'-phosphopantetheinyl transferase superfamily protein [Gilvimarinus agarilyticus]|uniref:4'-phosphopantetheinyl transferase family protein n=1 Tax=Gilvimarinus sp. 2_MG-2023 TaxID=3062666 RepID=UPI001C08504F|nr:4'-phosphopantetheinyl transferase superfamily protein [Gilvimarinus sp. 2_MG-2023]MBU2885729.1 4'-phosphopantetheinyl transferase superfamily protein [Gilvimarinus agarilyticus]MDO6570589.1 4'-phosphopantetheinyl transferase superfamily protein [Gilvimarinus sp. 2_MG-2023]
MTTHFHLVDLRKVPTWEEAPLHLKGRLCPRQLERAQALRRPDIRQQRLQQQLALFDLLDYYLPEDVRPISINRSEAGKPALTHHPKWHFNISHSGHWLALLLSDACAVGVDLEVPSKPRPLLAIAQQYFSEQEFARLQTLERDQLQSEFYRLWTLKEAFFKARGTGIAEGLGKIDFTHSQTPQSEQNWPLQHWQFYHQSLTHEDETLYLAAVFGRAETLPKLRTDYPIAG